MNNLKLLLNCFLLLYLLPNHSTAQETIDDYDINKFLIGIEIGYSSNFVSGEGNEELNKLVEEFESTGNENFDILSKKSPKQFPLIGVSFKYRFTEKISFGSGLRFTKRGYAIKIWGEEKDPEYQLDNYFKYEENYSINVFELPLTALYTFNEKWTVTAGAIVGVGLKNSAKFKYTIDQEVYVNGELSDELTADSKVNEENLTESPANPFIGGLISLDYNIARNLSASVSFSRAINYAELDYGKLSDTSFALSLKYSFISF